MKTIWILPLLILISSCGNPTIEEYYYPDGSIMNRYIIEDEDHYRYETFYENGSLQETGYIVKGKLEGFGITYYENGKIESTSTFKNGLYNGAIIFYDQNGEITERKYYLEDELFFAQVFKDNKLEQEHVIPIITQKINKDNELSFLVTIPFNDTLNYFNRTIDVKYAFAKDSASWEFDKVKSSLRLNKTQNEFEIVYDEYFQDDNFIKTLSTINVSKERAYLKVQRIKR